MCVYGKNDEVYGVFALAMKRQEKDYGFIDGTAYGLSNMVVEMAPKGADRKRAIYFKSASGRKCATSKDYHWKFSFSQEEIGGLVRLSESYDVQLGFFCRNSTDSGSDFVLVEHRNAFECIGAGVHIRGKIHVNVIQESRKHGFGVYGTGRERVVRVPHDGIREL